MSAIDQDSVRKIRLFVQLTVFAAVMYAGFSFYFFVRAVENGLVPSATRSPSIEGFMPIGALMALKLWLTERIFDPTHPAALALFISALLISLFLKKSFCSWICPVGAVSEAAGEAGKRIFGRNCALPKYLDLALRSLKYVLMAFFLYVILIKMTPTQIKQFLDTPYWKVADVKLLKFFTEMSPATQVSLGFLLALSLPYRNFWCRYLCPYGALLGLVSSASPAKIRRDASKCTQCGACGRHCPSLLPVDKKDVINSPECTGCLTCVSRCRAKGALAVALPGGRSIRPELFAASVVLLFFSAVLIAHAAGKWYSSVTVEELSNLIPHLSSLGHP